MSDAIEAEPLVALIVEDDESSRMLVERWLLRASFQVVAVESAEAALEALSLSVPDVICLDLELPGIDGLEALHRIHASHPTLPVILMTANASPDTIVRAVQRGAFDYIVKPLDAAKVLATLRRAAEGYRASLRSAMFERERTNADEYEGMVGRSDSMRALFGTLDRVADRNVTVLVRGESGSGKELVANAIHQRSTRARGPMIAVNCAAIPESLQEAELFGYEKGAFTGAVARRQGYIERAHGGTLFLDEVAELSARLQAQLLRVIEERQFSRLGGSEVLRSDFRLISASHADLHEKVREGKFREDLYFRLAVFDIDVPPLRARGDDVILLAERFIQKSAPHSSVALTEAARDALRRYAFPGNVRELRNAIERALVVCEPQRLDVDDLPARIRDVSVRVAASPSLGTNSELRAGETVDSMERRMLEDALERTGWNIAEVVRELGIGRTTVYRKIKAFGLVQRS